jgi:acetoin:2,6-dichlorophenolindophenol oxidoreductase subunit beta
MIFSRALGDTLRRALTEDPRVIVLGEDVCDPYGGAFKVTRGLSTDFPGRVRSTPISEGAIAGVAAGLALVGFRPIAEIMFGDFLTLCFDQVVNHIAKYEAMYAGAATCPVILRTPSGGGRGYGPTHSQSLEKHFLGVPHLRVAAASLRHDPDLVFDALLAGDEPTLYVEHKLLYPLHLATPASEHDASPGALPTACLRLVERERCAVTVVAYGYQAEIAWRVLERLAIEEELFGELLVPAQIAPLDWGPIVRSVGETGALLTSEEGTAGWSWGAEIAAGAARRLFADLRRPPAVLASLPGVIPGARDAEAAMLVGERQLETAVRELVR